MPRITVLLLLAAATAVVPDLWAQAAAPTQTGPLGLANRDTTCSACEDFYRWANGGWISRTPIPGDQPWWSAFHELQDRNFTDLHGLLDEAATQARRTSDPDTRRLGLFYASCMDSAAVEAVGIRPLAEELGRIAAIQDRGRLPQALARLQQRGVNAGYLFHSNPDAKQSRRTIAELYQAGLGLPDREYYFKPDSGSTAIRREYLAHVGRMLRLAGADNSRAEGEAASVMELETALARASMTIEQQRDPEAVYHLTNAADLQRQSPAIRWNDYVRERRIALPTELNVAQPEFLRAMDSLVAHAPMEQWRAYFRWRLLDAMAPSLSSAFVNEAFRFNGVVLPMPRPSTPEPTGWSPRPANTW